MKRVPTVSASVFLLALCSIPGPSFAQTACKSVDAGPAGFAARTAQSQPATPAQLAALAEIVAASKGGRIVNGEVTLIADNPWQVALIRSAVPEPTRSQFCGGSIIRNDWILTAGHCVRNSIVREDPTRLEVIAGTSQYAIGGERLKVAAIVTHPRYNQATMDNDFALLRLQTPMTKGQVVALADANTQLSDDMNMCVSGWGATSEGGPGALELLGANIPIVSNATCNQPDSYNGDILASMFCAGKKQGGVDSCQGDSGGPSSAVINGRATLIGVVSWGEGCARRLKYGVYSRISTAAEWIATTTAAR